ncbi:MAG: methyltransferase domain-containing protein [Bacteroidota bacterium]
MPILIANKPTSLGGPSSFIRNLTTYFDANKVDYQFELNNSVDALFVVFNADLALVKQIHEKGVPIIQRMDGVYHPLEFLDSYQNHNWVAKDIYLNYADHIVFQSEYSRKQCFSLFGELPKAKYSIIVNGADKNIYFPSNKSKSVKTRFISTGSFRKIDMLEPIIKALDELDGLFDFEYVLIGPVADNLKYLIEEKKYIIHYESMNNIEIADELRKSDIFIFSYLNPACPNSVVEAISCGLPIVGFDSGSLSELSFFNIDLLAKVKGGVFQYFSQFDYLLLKEKFVRCVENYDFYRNISLKYADFYSFDKCGSAYVDVINKVKLNHIRVNNSFMAKLKIRIKDFLTQPFFESLIEQKWRNLDDERLLLKLKNLINQRSEQRSSFESLHFFFKLDKWVEEKEGRESVRYGQGVHPKHFQMRYHDFFIDRINPDENVLDVGCGYGSVAFDIANSIENCHVIGIDIEKHNIDEANKMHVHNNITYIHADALKYMPDEKIDCIVLSNVLEHIEDRITFLKLLSNHYQPKRTLIRVPMYERSWVVPMKKELGADYFCDPTHYIEYTLTEFKNEVENAGLTIIYQQINWGEIWAEIHLK